MCILPYIDIVTPIRYHEGMRRGQALVMVLLIMAVVLTVGLSIGSQAVTDIRLSQKEEEAAKAFGAAEAGIEQVLVGSGTFTQGSVENATFQVAKTSLGLNQADFVYPNKVASGESATLFFMSHDANGDLSCSGLPCFYGASPTVTVYWGSPLDTTAASGLDTAPALETSIVYNEAGVFKIARGYFDPYNGSTNTDRINNNFANVSCSGSCNLGSEPFRFSQTLDLGPLGFNIPSRNNPGGLVAMRIKLLYNSNAQKVGVKVSGGTGLLPAQGIDITSVGTYGSSTQRVRIFQLFSDAPSVFDYTLFSGAGGIIK